DGLLPSINFHKITDKRTNNKPSPALHMPPQMCETFRTQPKIPMTHRPARNGFRVFCEDEQNSEEHEKMPPSVLGFEHYRFMFLFCGKSELFPDFQDQIIHLISRRIQ
ncbi:MAG: hypothetical protein LBG65_02850, partial [Puniceicoccales bacterium]|nr:hypothetical protein [Puniceicoccales bacterium]